MLEVGKYVRIKKYPSNWLLNKVGIIVHISQFSCPYEVRLIGKKYPDLFLESELEEITEDEAFARMI